MKKNRPKSKPKDAFYFYHLQFEKTNNGQTCHKGITDSTAAAYDSWMRMTLQQREPFESLAQEDKALRQQNANNQKDKMAKIKEKEYADICETINGIVAKSFLNNTYKTQEYYFVAANVFCYTNTNKYYPAELAIMKFTLQDGFVQAFHTFISPDNIPIGYGFDALCLSNETHLLPVPPNAMGEKNYALIIDEIDQWIGKASEFSPLFTLEENIPMVESIIREFCAAANTTCRYKVLPLNQLFIDLKEQTAKRNNDASLRFKNIDEATELLNSDKYTFSQIACQYHDEKDRSKFCSLSAVKRWAYAISESICTDLQIPLVTDKHYPTKLEPRVPIFEDYESDSQSYSQSDSQSDYYANEESSFYDVNDTLGAMGNTYNEKDLNSNTPEIVSYLEDQDGRVDGILTSNLGSLQLQECESIIVRSRGRGRKIE